MAFRPDHELHRRRFSRNAGLGIVLVLFVLLIFGMSIAKVQMGNEAAAKAGKPRPGITPIGMSLPDTVRP